MKMRMESINATCKQIWMVKVFPRITKHACSTKQCKMYVNMKIFLELRFAVTMTTIKFHPNGIR